MTHRKKLIEVALPLEAINEASAREKSIRHGHPSTLHLWWARRPLAAARAVIFASLVDDPDSPDALPAFVDACKRLPGGANTAIEDTPRMRLFDFIERLVKWESTTDEAILNTARELIQIATEGNPPPLLDPFAGGGSIPLEAQRLGLEAHASDLNPVAVMINKAQIEIPPRFANMPPVNPRDSAKGTGGDAQWRGASGLAADVRYYGEWMREKAWERIGHLYPKYHPSPSGRGDGGEGGETVIAWLWARTVLSPNPAVNAFVPLVRSFVLSKKKGRECWAKPVVFEPDDALMLVGGRLGQKVQQVRFEVTQGTPPKGQEGTVNRNGGTCIISGEPIPFEYIREEGKAGRMSAMLMAIVTEGQGGRSYYSPTSEQSDVAEQAQPEWKPMGDIPEQALGFRVQLYGMDEYNKLFTPRQLVALTTFSDLVAEAREQVYMDAKAAGLPDDDMPLREYGSGALAYAEAVSVYLTFVVDRSTDYWSSLCGWHYSGEKIDHVFRRQALSMVWDYAETNPFSDASGNWLGATAWIERALETLPAKSFGDVRQADAAKIHVDDWITLSTDPPYYDNIGYADLSDYFYIWMRRDLQEVYPDIFDTLLTPKEPELIAAPYRHGSKEAANQHFESGMRQTFRNIRRFITPYYPLTIFYAFKQQDTDVLEDDQDIDIVQIASTGWETMITSLLETGFIIGGTFPMRTEMSVRLRNIDSNALASSIVLVCRPRPDDAPTTSRRAFLSSLRQELPLALKDLLIPCCSSMSNSWLVPARLRWKRDRSLATRATTSGSPRRRFSASHSGRFFSEVPER
ncbi:MAG: DUF1156 domain-containing protein [Anaerolineae bacterium]|nr:MAG: DUF1156 domain-containing protein [Anaerolineae bacterium]